MLHLQQVCSCRVHNEGVGSLWFCSDASLLISATCEWDVEEDDLSGVLKAWSLDQKIIWCQRDLAFGGHAALSPDGKLLAWAGEKGRVRVFNVPADEELDSLQLKPDRNVNPILFSPRGDLLFAALGRSIDEDTGEVTAWDTASWRLLYSLPTGWVMSLALSSDGLTLAVGLVDGGLQLWDLPSRQCLAAIPAHGAQVVSVAFNPSGRLLATAGMSENLRLWDIANGEPTGRDISEPEVGSAKGINVLAFLPTGELITGNEAGHIMLWEAHSGAVQAQYSTNDAFLDFRLIEEEDQLTLQSVKAPEVTALAVSADGRRVAAGNLKGGVQIWAVEPDA